jgi:hypothetical protein
MLSMIPPRPMLLKEVTVFRILGVLRCWYMSMTNFMDSRSITLLGSDPVRRKYLARNSLLAANAMAELVAVGVLSTSLLMKS